MVRAVLRVRVREDGGGGPVPSVSVPSPKASSQCAIGTLSCATIENWTLSGTGPDGGLGVSVKAICFGSLTVAQSGSFPPSG